MIMFSKQFDDLFGGGPGEVAGPTTVEEDGAVREPTPSIAPPVPVSAPASASVVSKTRGLFDDDDEDGGAGFLTARPTVIRGPEPEVKQPAPRAQASALSLFDEEGGDHDIFSSILKVKLNDIRPDPLRLNASSRVYATPPAAPAGKASQHDGTRVGQGPRRLTFW
jgi:hypothetical protein